MSGYYPPSGPPPQQFGHPQQPPPPQGHWGGPPQNSMGGYGAQFQPPPHPPPGHSQPWPPQGLPPQGLPPQGLPPQGLPPQGMAPASFAPPGQPGFQQGMPQQGFHQGPPQMPPQQAYPPASMPSPGYGNDVAQMNANPDVDALMKAMSGIRRDHTTVIRILSKADPRYPALLRQTYAQRNGGANLEAKIESTFRSHYGDALLQLVRGPLLADVHNINRAIKGLGTKEDMLNDVLIGRSNADMQAIKATYQTVFKKTMESDVGGDLSLKTKTMFQLIMRASRTDESYPYNPVENTRDVDALYHAMRGPSIATNQEQVFTVLTQRSDNQIRAIAHEYQQKYHKSLEDAIRSGFSGHMEDALSLALGRATDRAKTDAFGMEDTMKGMGTKDNLLVNKTVRVHWDRQHMDQVKKAYQHFFKKDLISRVKGETSGDYRDCLVACLT
ncbi:hypothetical protein LTR05_006430 [Lithohypha guttulata]|uniref:Annexin n=1 Tax=Lithohypha guttulata TaxID=1690604 RepID=A0AAN7Y5R0_9EURO|nr:hypothetical protein LTR05_006430 [Lithohypha guttulata]